MKWVTCRGLLTISKCHNGGGDMRKANKLIALALGTLSFATISLTACDGMGVSGVQTPEINPEYVYNGTHIYTATDTNEYLVKAGQTDYKLVVPVESTATQSIASEEFVHLFKKATNITLEIVMDDAVTSADSGKYISLGRTTLLANSGIEVDYNELTKDGHRIVTKDDDIYLCGGTDYGTVFSVYTFMRLTFNYETYTYNTMVIDSVTEKKLKNYDVKDIPDFKTRSIASDVRTYVSQDYDENMLAWRLNYRGKNATRGANFMRVHEVTGDPTSASSASTNARRWFPEAMYKDETKTDMYHPKWFSDNGGQQLCFSAHGDEAEYELMVQTAFEKVAWTLTYYTPAKAPDQNVMTLTHEDNMNYCTCAKCYEISSYYGGSQAAVQILFMNDLAERVDALLEANKDKDWYREDFKLLFFAYNHNYTPPAKYDPIKKEYVPIDDDVVLHDRVIAWFCQNSNGQAVHDEGLNGQALGVLKGWAAVAEHIQYWTYAANFRNYMYNNDTYQYTTGEMYAYWCNVSDVSWFTQVQDHCKTPNTTWNHLRIFIESKMTWNTSLNQQELIEEYLTEVYKDAAPTMKQLYFSHRSYGRNVLINEFQLISNGDGAPEMGSVDYWPIGIVEGFIKLIDKSLEEIESYKESDPELYDQIAKNIELEGIQYMYILLDLHGNTLAKETRQSYIDRLKHDLVWLDIANMGVKTKTLTFKDWLNAL